MKLTFELTECEGASPCFTLFDGPNPVATIVTTLHPTAEDREKERQFANFICSAARLLQRAHDLMCGEHSADTFADCSDLVDDIRVALGLSVTDCDNCHQCIYKAAAVDRAGRTLCADCADDEDALA
jgi:hypothetical protein